MANFSKWFCEDGRTAVSLNPDNVGPVFAYLSQTAEGLWTIEPEGWASELVADKLFASKNEALDLLKEIAEKR